MENSMSKKDHLNEKPVTLNQEPEVPPTDETVVVPPPPSGGTQEPASPPPPVAPKAANPGDFTAKPGVEAEVWDTRVVKSGIRLSSPKVLLHVPAVFE